MDGFEVGFADVELASGLLSLVIFATVAVVSYRRSRYLGEYPVWRSLLIAFVAGTCWYIWIIVSWVNREQIAQEWRDTSGRSSL